jgi:hypothetical protein
MKKIATILFCITIVFAFSSQVIAADECTTVQDGVLYTTYGELVEPGFNIWGYNYGAHMFNGMYCDAYQNAPWCQEWADVELIMKWNDAWLSSKDCDDDGLLDRHYGYSSYMGSGAWTTNHMKGTYEFDGKKCKWVYFVKIVAVPSDAYLADGYWYTADGAEIGPVEWGDFAVIQSVYNDPCDGYGGIEYLSPVGPGLGKF